MLQALAGVLTEQRTAIVARDVAGLNRLFDTFSCLMADLSGMVGAAKKGTADPGFGNEPGFSALAKQVREQLRINQALLRNGMAIADHYAVTAAEMDAVADLGMFRGVG